MTNRKLTLFIAASLDGYIATKEDSLEWLFAVEGEGDNGYSAFYEMIDTVLLGKRTYQWLLDFESEDFPFPYKDKACYVFTNSNLPAHEHATFIDDDVTSFLQELKQKPGKNIWLVGGGDLIHSFYEKDLIDEIIVTVSPVLLGNGIPLFKESNHSLNLTLKQTQTFNQFVELHYEVRR
ncbi:dihydrofolate reductase family protein [Alkalicoccobacillus porphyridii]|uniref:Dihydrofolate reductase n=1 Tax=Alkalicoccobacillus porphyridii TaxID=2597270 RepID=A0A554A2I6_9BACI|nr:dihydrofolate reductase family protein [Alkalicoccobacillus porphyridii]TSB47914.1 dihydrofolate reductase [Alkalicoccobacillus porphyridii]